ncbi:hypothetical protein [Ponticoccus alexandrii]|uniref:Uncharacterized protein n=1 Tax=Ponticoccus alexandrii TaxID=1943633 RepID=A0ABX7F9L5_9RHOB|nr:hypothetical protein [Ponticoccus alexandrii]ETA53985.1 hypothetical protein P279_00365 [Rhodobacteraceae bacterium PD-2]QRF66383.1 hypothetical protein GQA70_08710 [Ponticoccus alexandrii]
MKLHLDGAADRMDRELSLVEKTAFDTARLVMTGFHKPDKFPEWRHYAHTPGRPRERRRLSGAQIVAMIGAAVGKPVRTEA